MKRPDPAGLEPALTVMERLSSPRPNQLGHGQAAPGVYQVRSALLKGGNLVHTHSANMPTPTRIQRSRLPVTEALRNIAELPVKAESDVTHAEVFAKQLWAMALSGDSTAMKEVLDRLEGKATQRIEAGAIGETDRILDEIPIANLRAVLDAVGVTALAAGTDG